MSGPMAQGDQPQDPTPPAAPPAVAGPWANDISSTFNDPAVAGQVSQFLASKVQPYVTRLEQQGAGSKEAQEFYSSFQDDAGEAFLGVAEQLFGAEIADQILSVLAPEEEGAAAQVVEGTATEVNDPDKEWLKSFREKQEEAEALAEYDRDLDTLIAANPHVDRESFHPFVVSAEGDYDKALAGYNQWASKWGAGPKQDGPTPAPPATVPGGGTTPPTTKTYKSFDDAWADFRAEQSAAAPPTV